MAPTSRASWSAPTGSARCGRPRTFTPSWCNGRTPRTARCYALRDEELVPAEWLRPDPATAPVPEPESSTAAQILARAAQAAPNKQHAAPVEKAQGAGPRSRQVWAAAAAAGQPPPTLEELPAFVAAARAEAEREDQSSQGRRPRLTKAETAKRLAAAGMPPEEIQKRLDAEANGSADVQRCRHA